MLAFSLCYYLSISAAIGPKVCHNSCHVSVCSYLFLSLSLLVTLCLNVWRFYVINTHLHTSRVALACSRVCGSRWVYCLINFQSSLSHQHTRTPVFIFLLLFLSFILRLSGPSSWSHWHTSTIGGRGTPWWATEGTDMCTSMVNSKGQNDGEHGREKGKLTVRA